MNAPGSPSSPLQTMYLTARAAAAAKAGVGDLLNDLFPAHLEQGFGQRRVAADGEVFLNALGVDVAAVLQHAAGLLLVEGDVLLPLVELAVLLVAQALDKLAAQDGLLDDLFHVLGVNLGIEPALRLDAHQGAHLAEAVAAGFLDAGGVAAAAVVERKLVCGAVLGHLLFQFLVHGEVSARRAARAAADKHLALFMAARLDVLLLQGAEFFQIPDFFTHGFRPPL